MAVDGDSECAEEENTAEEMAATVMYRSRLIVCLGVRIGARCKRQQKSGTHQSTHEFFFRLVSNIIPMAIVGETERNRKNKSRRRRLARCDSNLIDISELDITTTTTKKNNNEEKSPTAHLLHLIRGDRMAKQDRCSRRAINYSLVDLFFRRVSLDRK